MGRSSVTLSRMEGDEDAPRLLRLRADTELVQRIEPGAGGDVSRLVIPTRESVDLGETILVEVSFGPLADEVLLQGVVRELQSHDAGRPRSVTIGFPTDEAERMRYLQQVLSGRRKASARRDRRVPVDFEVRWRWREFQYASRVRDLSRGGAFIASRWQPEVGADLDVELRPPSNERLQVDAVVSWVRNAGADPGFGVCFRIPDRATAARLTEFVRAEESLR